MECYLFRWDVAFEQLERMLNKVKKSNQTRVCCCVNKGKTMILAQDEETNLYILWDSERKSITTILNPKTDKMIEYLAKKWETMSYNTKMTTDENEIAREFYRVRTDVYENYETEKLRWGVLDGLIESMSNEKRTKYAEAFI